jgi:hypothetical protein
METKKCTSCQEDLSLLSFGKNKKTKDGLQSICKQCTNSLVKAWRESNSDKARACTKKWRSEHKEYDVAKAAKRKALKLSATPVWADKSKIKAEYALAQWCTDVMGSIYHVDHIVPLKGKTVCGLHVEANLRVIPASDNINKSNHSWPDMWETTV